MHEEARLEGGGGMAFCVSLTFSISLISFIFFLDTCLFIPLYTNNSEDFCVLM